MGTLICYPIRRCIYAIGEREQECRGPQIRRNEMFTDDDDDHAIKTPAVACRTFSVQTQFADAPTRRASSVYTCGLAGVRTSNVSVISISALFASTIWRLDERLAGGNSSHY